jgi:antitoxin component YwqK of YwqJK toxin-antitoxin module
MRVLSFVILLVLLARIGVCQSFEIIDKERIIKNKIRMQTLYEYDYKNGKKDTKGNKARVDSFDTKGNKIMQTNFRANGTIHFIVTAKYDAAGNRTEYNKFSPNDKDLKFKQKTRFDSKGNKLTEYGLNGNDSFKTVYNYNKLGKLAEVNYFLNGRLDEKRKFIYNGNVSELKVFDKNASLKFTQNNVYSPSGKLLEESRIEPDNSVSKKVVYTFDKNDNLITETKYLKGKQISKITRVYNNMKLLSEVYQETPNNPKALTNKYVSNDKNWLIEEQLRSDATSDLSKNTYSYDENGLCKTIDSYYAEYKHQVLSVFVYENY